VAFTSPDSPDGMLAFVSQEFVLGLYASTVKSE